MVKYGVGKQSHLRCAQHAVRLLCVSLCVVIKLVCQCLSSAVVINGYNVESGVIGLYAYW